jgi:imidazolonepropionase-like amidohydrolase
MTPLEAITCATKNAALAMRKENELGCIAPGFKADLLVVDGDPSKDVTLLGNRNLIKRVILDGKDVDLTPAPERVKDPAGWRISSYSQQILKK